MQRGRCNSTDLGEFILAPNATEKSNAVILTKAIHLNDPAPIRYPIKKTGYYCVVTDAFTAEKYNVVTEFRNAYGELLATQIPKLPFYGGMTILYALVCVFWGLLYYQHRHDICEQASSAGHIAPLTSLSGCSKLHYHDFDLPGG